MSPARIGDLVRPRTWQEHDFEVTDTRPGEIHTNYFGWEKSHKFSTVRTLDERIADAPEYVAAAALERKRPDLWRQAAEQELARLLRLRNR